MEPLSLSSEGRFPPLLERCRAVVLIDGFVEASWKAFSKMSDSKGIIDVKMGMANKFFKLGNVAVGILRVHFEALQDDGPGLFFLQNISVLSTEGREGAVI